MIEIGNKKVVTFGEIMLRLATPGYQRLFQEKELKATFCGAEANVAVDLQQLGQDARFITTVPKNDIGNACIADVRYFGVDTSKIVQKGARLGTFYLEKGASQRPSKVIYDRQYSAFSFAECGDYDWRTIFVDAGWFHFTGINPALSPSVDRLCEEACKAAKDLGVIVSCDLNFRSTLWSKEAANASMSRLMKHVDVCLANEEDVENVFGINATNTDISCGVINKDGYAEVGKQVSERFGCKIVAFTLRESISANDNKWSGVIYDASENKAYFSSKTFFIHIVDRVGSGDSFSAGIIYALSHGYKLQEAVDFAVAVSCLKHTIEGDYNRITLEEVKKLLASSGNGRITR